MPDLKCSNVILCDEIRQEKSEKYILLGVYSSGLLIQKMPAELRIALYVTVFVPNNGRNDIVITAEFHKTKVKMDVGVEVEDNNYAMAIPTPPFPLKFDEPGDLIISVGGTEDTLKEVARFPVRINPDVWSMYPNDFEQPSEQSLPGVQGSSSPPEPSPQAPQRSGGALNVIALILDLASGDLRDLDGAPDGVSWSLLSSWTLRHVRSSYWNRIATRSGIECGTRRGR